MKKLIALTLALLTLFLSLTACTGTSAVTGDPVDYIERKIKKSAYLIDYVSVSTNGKRKVDISVTFRIHGNDVCFFGENAKNIYEAATAAASETGKRIGDLSIRMDYNNEQDYIRWTQIIGSFGDLMHSRPGYTPGDFCTIGKATRYFNYNNKDKFADIINETTEPPTTTPPTTEDPGAEQKIADTEFIKKQISKHSIYNQLDVSGYVYYYGEKSITIQLYVYLRKNREDSLLILSKMDSILDTIRDSLKVTQRDLKEVVIKYHDATGLDIDHIEWVSGDMKNGILYVFPKHSNIHDPETSCTLEEFLDYIKQNTIITEETTF